MDVTVFQDDRFEAVANPDLRELLAKEGCLIWVDMTGPSAADVAVLREVFRFHPLTIDDTINHKQRPKIEEFPGYAFIIVNPVSIHRRSMDFRELDIYVGRNFLVTVHEGSESMIETTRKRLIQSMPALPMTVNYLLYVLMDTIVDHYFPIIESIEEEIAELEDLILAHPRQQHLNRLFQIKRTLINFWRVIWPQRDILSVLSQPHVLAFADHASTQYYMRDVSDHLLWIADMVTVARDTVTGIVDLYMSAVSNRLNKVVNRLTIFTLGIGLLTVISGFYGMNFLTTWPPFEKDWGVLFVLGLMALVIFGMGFLVRRLRWY